MHTWKCHQTMPLAACNRQEPGPVDKPCSPFPPGKTFSIILLRTWPIDALQRLSLPLGSSLVSPAENSAVLHA